MIAKIDIQKGQGINMYAVPNNSAEAIAVLEADDIVNVKAIKGDYAQVTWAGVEGWVAKKFLLMSEQTVNGVADKNLKKRIKGAVRTTDKPVSSKKGTRRKFNKAKNTTVSEGVGGWFSDLKQKAKELIYGKEATATATTTDSGYKSGQALYITSSSLRLRKEPSLNAEVLEQITNGKAVTVQDSNATSADGYVWVKVTYNGKTGYVAAQYLSISPVATEKVAEEEQPTNNNNNMTLSENAKSILKKVAIGAVVAGAAFGIYKVATKKGSSSTQKKSTPALNGCGGRKKKRKMKRLQLM